MSATRSAQLRRVHQQTSADVIFSNSHLNKMLAVGENPGQQYGEPDLQNAAQIIGRIAEELQQADPGLMSPVSTLAKQLAVLYRFRQAELEEKETLTNRLSTLLTALPAGVVVLDARGFVQECNPAAVDLLGEPLSGERWVDIIARSFSPRADDGHEVSLRDGRRLSIQTRSLDNGFGQLILMSDLTETRVLQEGLARHQRLSAMGKTVASLAHQIRTPLSAAMLFADHLCTPDLSPQLRIKCAQKLVSRLGHLEQQVRDMLLFAKGDSPVAENLRVTDLLHDIQVAADGLSAVHGVSIEWDIPETRVALVGNKDALVGAVMNLINNAAEACNNRQMPRIQVALSIGLESISITVVDNGSGFEPRAGLKLAEAFYTTKANGTGLGLAVVQSVAKAHQGHFFITSRGVGYGAEAKLSLPVKLTAKQQATTEESV